MASEYTQPVAQLLTYGDPREETEWPDYLSLGFTEEHIPELIKMAIDEDLNWTRSDCPEIWAPIHAWRALGQLKTEQAIEPLMALFKLSEDFDDDWSMLELPTVYSMIGQKAIPALSRYLSDNSADTLCCISVVECIKEIGKTHAEAKLECAQAFSAQLERFHHNSPTLNGFLISGLVKLQAVDHLSLIRKAFKKRRVDLSIIGDIEEVEILFGVRTKRSTPAPPFFGTEPQFPSMFENDNSNRQPQTLKIGRNDPCPCGSGRKYKKCCLNR